MVGVGIDINESRRQLIAKAVNNNIGRLVGKIANGGNFVVLN